MTIGPTTRRLSIALLAQVVFCLVAAPILAAEQWAPPAALAKEGSTPTNPTSKITAAFDASNVKPEEVSDAEQKRGKPRPGGRKTPGLRSDTSIQFKENSSTKDTKSTKKKISSHFFVPFVPFVDNNSFRPAQFAEDAPQIVASPKTPRQVQPAFQPTGPPLDWNCIS